MADLLQGLMQGFNNPMMGVAAGLLSGAAPGGNLGQGLSQGIGLAQVMQQNQFRNNMATRMLTRQLEEEQWNRRFRERQLSWQQQQAADQLARDEAERQRRMAIYGTQEKPTSKQIEAVSAGIHPGTPEYSEFVQPRAMVEITNAPQRAEMGEAVNLAATEGTLDLLDQAEGILDSDPNSLLSPTRAFLAGQEDQPFIGEAIGATIPTTTNQQELLRVGERIKSQVIKALSGANATEAEADRITSQIPIQGQRPDVYRSNLEATRRNLEALNKRIIEMRNLDVTPQQRTRQGPASPGTGGRPSWATDENRM